ncbi:MAG: hypothetical protein ACREUT_14950 [Steroidobacteraceae bacterium]
MTRVKICAAFAAAAIVTSLPSFADCTLPPPPSKIPNGSTASEQEMLAAMNTLKEYNGDVSVYLKCLDYEVKQNRMASSLRDVKNNSAVTELQSIADKFNQQVRAFKAKHG